MSAEVCPYCQHGKQNKPLFEDRVVYEPDEMEKIVTIEEYGGRYSLGRYSLEIETYSLTASACISIPINFCPVCGRKLPDD